MKFRNIRLHGFVASIVMLSMAALATHRLTVQPVQAYSTFDERGQAIPSLFHGAAKDARFRTPFWHTARLNACKAPFLREFLTTVRRHAPFVDIQAFSCGGGGGCAGHWMVNYSPPCTGSGMGCGSGYADAWYSFEGQAGYCDGSRITGNDACAGCTCEDVSCNSCA